MVNNAGALMPTTLIDGDTKLWRKGFDLNMFAVCITSRETIRDIISNDLYGHIIQINSVAGHGEVGLPKMNIYAASKRAVIAFNETLDVELRDVKNNIKVTVSITQNTNE